MTLPKAPSAALSTLQRADGSASYSWNGYSVIGAVNGPIEVQRRDELPEEAAIEVVVRPAAGVGGVRERHLESIIQSTLRHIILVQNHPRTLIQVTLQVTATPPNDSAFGRLPQAASNLPILPALLQTTILALLSTSLPLSMTLSSTIVAVTSTKNIIQDPFPQQLRKAASVHVLAFSSQRDLLVAESEGVFDVDIWERVFEEGKRICVGDESGEDDSDAMDTGNNSGLQGVLRDVVGEKVNNDQRWKEA
ncbi:Ribosomal protein S5 domain 2-type fold [Lasallia pustulata]|uniref:Ribosomal protein S5 domain 2-type fold n=1 Tax=Lasallia pustulata TaxID=136370 RepID=A0A1W5DCW1_9LECA|nr:Ribosomal protein S5 domain 2-type fold [Lasallia pustulata]